MMIYGDDIPKILGKSEYTQIKAAEQERIGSEALPVQNCRTHVSIRKCVLCLYEFIPGSFQCRNDSEDRQIKMVIGVATPP